MSAVVSSDEQAFILLRSTLLVRVRYTVWSLSSASAGNGVRELDSVGVRTWVIN